MNKDKSAYPNADVVKQKVDKQNYNNQDSAKYLIMHYKHQHIPEHTMQPILLQTTIPKALFLCHWEKSGLRALTRLKKPVDQAKSAACS